MHYTREDIKKMDKVERLTVVNAVSGIKPANLIGSISDHGHANLAIFSSVVHLGSDPALLGFICRPVGEVPRHTYENIMENGTYTINHIPSSHAQNAHYTSAKFDKETSEFEACGFIAEYVSDFKAPFVKESRLKMGMQFLEALPIQRNGTVLIIGEIQELLIADEAIVDGDIDLESINSIGISGLNSYYGLKKVERYPYARVNDLPDFKIQ
ncbi:MAG: flavin reductase [Bacteroidota bacterium]